MIRSIVAALLLATLAAGRVSAAPPISIDARDTDLNDVIALIARQSGLNIVADASVKPRRISFRLHDVDMDTALAALAQAYDLQTHRDGNIIFIGDAAAMTRRYDGSTNATTVTLRNAKPSDAIKELKGALPEGSMFADDRSNTVIVTGNADAQTAARSLLNAVDAPGSQVMFEVRVTDVKPVDDSSNVGIQFGGTGFGAGAVAQFPYALTKNALAVNAQINALVTNGRAQILATPRIATLNNREATLLVGEVYPIVTVNQQTGFPTVTNVDVGVKLHLTPTIGGDGDDHGRHRARVQRDHRIQRKLSDHRQPQGRRDIARPRRRDHRARRPLRGHLVRDDFQAAVSGRHPDSRSVLQEQGHRAATR